MTQQAYTEPKCRECDTRLDLTGWCPTCQDVVTNADDRRLEFLRRLDVLIAYANAQPFRGRRKALMALNQIRKSRNLDGR